MEEEKIITTEEIEDLSDQFFPFRNKNGEPSYQEYQRDTIIKICKAYLIDNKKFVAVEGPVGCGKSVINYTVARIMGEAVYLTPLKMLQDQIMDENWPGVKMLKGSSAYACNFCGLDEYHLKYRTNYSGDKFDTCNTAGQTNKFDDKTLEKVGDSIKNIHNMFSNNKYALKLRSSFSSYQEYSDLLPKMKEFIMKKKRDYLEKRGYLGEVKYKNDLEKSIACTMGNFECSLKSAKLLTKMAPIKVLNPDIFYKLSYGDDGDYNNNELMIYDECHQIENVVKRIFQVKVPLNTVKDFFGLDLLYLYDLKDMGELLPKTSECVFETIGPLYALSKLVSRLGDLLTINNFATLKRCRSKTDLANKFYSCATSILLDGRIDISIMDIIIKSIRGEFFEDNDFLNKLNPFMIMVNDFFNKKCESIGCGTDIKEYENFVNNFLRRNTPERMSEMRKSRTRVLTNAEKKDGLSLLSVLVPKDRILADHLILFGNIIEQFVLTVSNLSRVTNNDYPCFSINKTNEPKKDACRATKYLSLFDVDSNYARSYDKCLEVVPILVGPLMNVFFYSKAEHVLLTSGTWIGKDSLFRIYGLPKDCEFIKIPSTFNPNNRRIYVIDNKNFMDFSKKRNDGIYYYKTELGARQFTKDLSAIVNNVRGFIKQQKKENSNIIIHTHTFDISKKIAEFYPSLDDNVLIHIPNGISIVNVNNGFVTNSRTKDELIQIIKDNPNAGMTIVSPSVSEGVDFKNEIARAQIILKRPVPYLGDIYVRSYYQGNPDVGLERDPDYLDRVCYTTITQQYGRVVRGRDDWGVTIIMDQSITNSLKLMLTPSGKKRSDDLNIGYIMDGIRYSMINNKTPEFKWIFKK